MLDIEQAFERNDVFAPTIRASMWWCGDDECNCHQPQIDLLIPRKLGRMTIFDRYEVWRGKFISDPDYEEFKEQKRELRQRAAELGIEMEEEFEEAGSRDATPDEVREYKRLELRR